jgi:hypothetical protein
MVYSDVVKNGWILPYKVKYTMKDFKKIHGLHDAITSRFIIICSVVYHCENGKICDYSQIFNNINKFLYMEG